MDKAVMIEEEPEQKRQKSEDVQTKDEETTSVPTVSFFDCLNSWAAETTLNDFRWNHLENAVAKATSTTTLSNFPRYLFFQIQRYTMGDDWTPKKLEINLDIPFELDMTPYKSKGAQEGETLVPDEKEETNANTDSEGNQIDEGALAQLMEMGFTMNGCKRALTAVGGSNVEAAMSWVFEHNMDPDFNDPIPDAKATAPSNTQEVEEGTVISLVESLGCFTFDQVRAALKHTNGAADRAADWLFSHMDDLDGALASLVPNESSTTCSDSGKMIPLDDGEGKYTMIGMISHIGKNTGSGHYVAHMKRDEKWVIFNDEKVAISESPPLAHAYLYLYQRKDTIGSLHSKY